MRGVRPCFLETFALSYLKSKVSEAGYKYNDKGRTEYVDSCKELVDYDSPESVTREEAASEVAYILTFSNVMIVDMVSRASVSTEVMDLISDIIREKLTASVIQSA